MVAARPSVNSSKRLILLTTDFSEDAPRRCADAIGDDQGSARRIQPFGALEEAHVTARAGEEQPCKQTGSRSAHNPDRLAGRAVLHNVPEILQTSLPALLRSNDDFVRLVLRLSGQGAFMFSARRNFKLPIKKQAPSSLSRKRTPLDKQYNEEVREAAKYTHEH